MELVGAGAGNHIDLGARIAPVLGGEVMREDADLLHGVRGRIVHARVPGRVVEVAPVEREQVHVGAASVDVHFGTAASVIHLLRRRDPEDAGQNASQPDYVAAVERKIDHAPVVDQARQRVRCGIDQGSGRRDRDLGLRGADLQARVDAEVLVDRELQTGADFAFETCRFKSNLVVAGRHRGEGVEAVRVGLSFANGLLLHHFGGHLRSRNDGARRVLDEPVDRSGRQLRMKGSEQGRAENHQKGPDAETPHSTPLRSLMPLMPLP